MRASPRATRSAIELARLFAPGPAPVLRCAPAHTFLFIIPPAVDPAARGAGLAPRVKVERPTGRTTLTRGAWSTRLARVEGGGLIRLNPSHFRRSDLCARPIIPKPDAPAGGAKGLPFSVG